MVMPFAFHGHLPSPALVQAQGSAQAAELKPVVTFKGQTAGRRFCPMQTLPREQPLCLVMNLMQSARMSS
jgi:hypothetical protein